MYSIHALITDQATYVSEKAAIYREPLDCCVNFKDTFVDLYISLYDLKDLDVNTRVTPGLLHEIWMFWIF